MILVARDNTTRFAIVKATQSDVKTTVKFILRDILPCKAMTAEIQTDRGTHFVSESLKQLYKALGVTHQTSTAYRLKIRM